VEEGQLHLRNESLAQDWLTKISAVEPTVWSNDGLVVQWGIMPGCSQLNVTLWQLCIDNRKPTRLDGAHDEAFTIKSTSGLRGCTPVSEEVENESYSQWVAWWSGD
jgi:hypothetical protein